MSRGSRGPNRPARGRWAPITPAIEVPWRWSLRIGRLAGVEVRLHALLGAWIGLVGVRMAAGPLWSDTAPRSAGLVAMGGGAVILAGLLMELGRQAAARRLGVRPLVVSLWPLGGLEDLPHHASVTDRVRTTTTGLAGLLAAVLVVGLVLAGVTGTILGVAVPSPTGDVAPGVLQLRNGDQPWWLPVLHELQRGLVTVLALHLVPMPPMAAGRLVDALARDRRGSAAGRRLALQVGVIASTVLLLGAVAIQAWLGVLAAVVGGLAATGELAERGRGGAANGLTDDDLIDEPASILLAPPGRESSAGDEERPARDDVAAGAPASPDLDWLDIELEPAEEPETEGDDPPPAAPEPAVALPEPGAGGARPRPEPRPEPGPADDPAEALDRVLEKIAREGMDGLDDEDRAVLEAETRRRRSGG